MERKIKVLLWVSAWAMGLLSICACTPKGNVILRAGDVQTVQSAVGEGMLEAEENGQAMAPTTQTGAAEEKAGAEAPGALEPATSAAPKPTAQYASLEEFLTDIQRFAFTAEEFPQRFNQAAEGTSASVRCPELVWSDLTKGHYGAVTDTVFIHLHEPESQGIYELSVGEMDALKDKKAPHDAFMQTALALLATAGDLTAEQAMAWMDELGVADPLSIPNGQTSLTKNGLTVTMALRDGQDLRLAVHRTTPREKKE